MGLMPPPEKAHSLYVCPRDLHTKLSNHCSGFWPGLKGGPAADAAGPLPFLGLLPLALLPSLPLPLR